MPIYEYACTACGHQFEALVSLSAANPDCGLCGAPTRKLMSAHGGIVMKQGGGQVREGLCCGQAGGCDNPKRCCEN